MASRKIGWALVAFFASAQFAFAATPRPQPQSFGGSWNPVDRIAVRSYPAIDIQAVAAEDAAREAAGGPHRFAVPRDEALDARDVGTWEQQGDKSIWRYRIMADKAASLNVGFTRFHVPPSARLYLYDTARRQVAGPYDARHNEPHAQLWTPIIASSDVVIELDVATVERSQVELVIGRIGQGYRGFGTASKGYHQPDLGQDKQAGGKTCSPSEVLSGRCNMDVACLADDDPWNEPRRAVGAIQLGGIDDCTGSLVNNTAGDRRMLFITASHCGLTQSSSPTVVSYWNYEWPTCRTPGSTESGQSSPPDPNVSSSGATFLAATGNPFGGCSGATCSDNTLVEFDEAPDPEWNLFWEGWDRRTVGAACSAPADPSSTDGLCASIHHPNVDEKRITFVEQNLVVGGISGGSNTHWHAYWDPTPPVLPNIPSPPPSLPPGVTEPGSSGSPLFTSEQRLVGVLSGGPSSCGATGEDLSDYYGQLALAWEGTGTPTTRLKDYLDPLGSAPEFIDGIGSSPFTLTLDPPSLAACATAGSATVDVDVAADAGFSGTVDLSASGEPSGSTVAFAPPSVTPPGTSVLTIGSLGSAAPGAYALTITGTSGDDTVTKSLPFALNDAAPAAVTLSAPADNATNVALSPTLSWSAATSGGPTDYLVEVATDAGFATIVFSTTVHDATSVNVTPALDPVTTYYWRVTASNTCGGGTASATFRFTTLAAPGSCTPPTTPNTLFEDDVENGENGWTTTGSTGDSTWTLSTARPFSGTTSWFAADLDSESDQRLISPAIALPADQNPITLRFENWREIEDNLPDGCYDGGLIEVSTDGGATFTQIPDSAILEDGGYDGVISDQFDNPLAGLEAWCSSDPRPYEDGPVLVDLTSYAGQSVQLRFRLGSDSSVSHEGWYVDDISVTSCEGEATDDTIFANGFEAP